LASVPGTPPPVEPDRSAEAVEPQGETLSNQRSRPKREPLHDPATRAVDPGLRRRSTSVYWADHTSRRALFGRHDGLARLIIPYADRSSETRFRGNVAASGRIKTFSSAV
jgi:hypothetical protein